MDTLTSIQLKHGIKELSSKCFFCGTFQKSYDAAGRCVIYCPVCIEKNKNLESDRKRVEIIERYEGVSMPTEMCLSEKDAKVFYTDKYGRW